jgi:hypothetical protein
MYYVIKNRYIHGVICKSRKRSVGAVIGHRLNSLGSIPGKGMNFLLSIATRPNLGFT